MKPPKRKAEDRLLSMPDLADLLGLAGPWRCKYAVRLFRRLERRDAERYLERCGKRRLFVRISTVERLLPWSPGTVAGMRHDLDEIGNQVATLKKRVNDHGARLRNLETFQRLTREYLAQTAGLQRTG